MDVPMIAYEWGDSYIDAFTGEILTDEDIMKLGYEVVSKRRAEELIEFYLETK